MASNTYVALATQTLGSAAASVTFSSIPSGYTDLVIVASHLGTLATAEARIQLNGDTATNYSWTQLYGNGTSAASYRASNVANIPLFPNEASSTTAPSVFVINIQNYSNATTYKTMLWRSNITPLAISANVGLWRKTPEAITSINIFTNTSTFATGSTFSLYGVAAASAPTAKATGGTITYDASGYIYHTFTGNGTFTPLSSLSCEYLMLAGGGGGGYDIGGGGGAGGLLYGSSTLSATGYAITVGAGGTVTGGGVASPGGNTTFNSLTATGGAIGGDLSVSGSSGGSGGGGGGGATSGGTGTSGQGNDGGAGSGSSTSRRGGGGGGAGGVGGVGSGSIGGSGGSGISTYSTWATVTSTGSSGAYAGGGGGGAGSAVAAGGTATAGGGAGGKNNNGGNGSANTGGGGGGGAGGGYNGGAGGSGVVIVRYLA